MKLLFCLPVVIAIAFFFCHSALADDDDRAPWRPDNAAATTITGPIVVGRRSLHAGSAELSLRFNASIAVFKNGQNRFPAHIYAVTGMSNPSLLNGQTLCGDMPPTWIVLVPQPPLGLELDAYTSVEKPTSAASPGLCNTFTYVR